MILDSVQLKNNINHSARQTKREKIRKLKLSGKVNIHLDTDEEKKTYLEDTYKKVLTLQCNEMEKMRGTKN